MIAPIWPRQEELKPHLRSGRKIRIERRPPSNPRLNGYLVGLSPTLGLMHWFDAFQPNGYMIFRLEDIESVRSNEYERHWDQMLAGEGLLGGLDDPPPIRLSSISDALTSIDAQFGRMIIECEDQQQCIQDYFIGKLVSIAGSTVKFDNFNPLGHWDDETHSIELNEITLIQCESVYLKTFSKYLHGTPASQREGGLEQR